MDETKLLQEDTDGEDDKKVCPEDDKEKKLEQQVSQDKPNYSQKDKTIYPQIHLK